MATTYEIYIKTQKALGKPIGKIWDEIYKIRSKYMVDDTCKGKEVKMPKSWSQEKITFLCYDDIAKALSKILNQKCKKKVHPYTCMREDIYNKTGYTIESHKIANVVNKRVKYITEKFYDVFTDYISHYGFTTDKEKDKQCFYESRKHLEIIKEFMKKHKLGTFHTYSYFDKRIHLKMSKSNFSMVMNDRLKRVSQKTENDLIRIANYIKKHNLI